MVYLVDDVDEDLGVAPPETTDHLGRLPARADCLKEQNPFTLVGSATDQGLQGSFTRVEGEGWCRAAAFAGSSIVHLM